MKANKQSKIKVPKSGFKRSKFNWNHDVNTTFTWGEIQPTQVKMIQPGSKTTMKAQNLIRLAPMVAPTFGRVKYKTFNQFVPVSDIFENYASLMSQEPVNRNGRVKVAQAIPAVKLGQLSAWCLQGARATLYYVNESLAGTNALREAAARAGNYVTGFRVEAPAGGSLVTPSQASGMLNFLSSNGIGMYTQTSLTPWSNVPGASRLSADHGNYMQIRPSVMDSNWNAVWRGPDGSNLPNDYVITLSNAGTGGSFFPADPGIDRAHVLAMDPNDHYVTLEGADYIVEFCAVITDDGDAGTGKHYFALAFEFSDFGKRIRKILQGCGYQIDFASSQWVSILPLLAQYKAYFDIFGLQLYQGWETTYCAKLIDFIKNNFIETIEANTARGQASNTTRIFGYTPGTSTTMSGFESSFCSFMLAEVANEWYTEDPDFIGAHQSKLAVSPQVDPSGFISVDAGGIDAGAHVEGSTNVQGGTSINYSQEDTNTDSGILVTNATYDSVHSFINQVQHGQVDADLLKRMYRWTNRNTILGREIAKILRAQNLGKYVDECKSDFIGSTDDLITISDVVSLADTDTGSGSGAVLGEYGGRGLQYIDDKVLVFENDELGYWITLATIVPEAGYTQGLDPTLKCLDKFSMYNADFDALGMELTTKDAVVGNSFITSEFNANHEAANFSGFGFVPRYSKWKVAYNLVNGDFNRHNMRNTYLPYTLDKQLTVNDYEQANSREYTLTNGDKYIAITLKRSLAKENLPVAGNIYRMPTKYPWLGNFDRIFMNIGKRWTLDSGADTGYPAYSGNPVIGFSDYNSDNFLSHGIMEVSCYAPMKPIEDSYGLDEDESPISGAEFVTKA